MSTKQEATYICNVSSKIRNMNSIKSTLNPPENRSVSKIGYNVTQYVTKNQSRDK